MKRTAGSLLKQRKPAVLVKNVTKIISLPLSYEVWNPALSYGYVRKPE